jgi:polyisoprenoid-binding protein YceI
MAKWSIDTAHSNVEFTVRHMMITNVRGAFREFDATLEFDPENPAEAAVNATIGVSSIDTGAADRDNHLRSPDFFEVETYPTLTFESTNVELENDKVARVHGNLTIRDVTQPVVLDVTFLGEGTNPWGVKVAGFEASTKINREAFGLTWNQALEAGGVLVGKEIKIELNVQFNPVTEAAPA